MEDTNVELTSEVIPFAKVNGGEPNVELVAASADVATTKVNEAIGLQDQIKDLQAKLRQSEINVLVERMQSLVGWATANQLQQMETQRLLRELGWTPKQQG